MVPVHRVVILYTQAYTVNNHGTCSPFAYVCSFTFLFMPIAWRILYSEVPSCRGYITGEHNPKTSFAKLYLPLIESYTFIEIGN